MTLNLARLADFEPRWSGRTLHLTIRSEPLRATVSMLAIGPDDVHLNGESMPGPYTDIRVKARARRDAPPELFVVVEDQRPTWIEIPCQDLPHLAELARVGHAWATRPEVRQAWGTQALGSMLVPEITREMRRKAGMLDRLEGLAVPLVYGSWWDRVRGMFQPDHQLLVFQDQGMLVRGVEVPYAEITASWSVSDAWYVQTASATFDCTTNDFRGLADLAALVAHLSDLPPDQTGDALERLTQSAHPDA